MGDGGGREEESRRGERVIGGEKKHKEWKERIEKKNDNDNE